MAALGAVRLDGFHWNLMELKFKFHFLLARRLHLLALRSPSPLPPARLYHSIGPPPAHLQHSIGPKTLLYSACLFDIERSQLSRSRFTRVGGREPGCLQIIFKETKYYL
ncbi:hypothetical protein L1987_59897 [Smallanthus sonchifolius]|uniref:Uncharacterized protein n=1 Tax=Smallanthus sonchifolius TaxID=185202 RepID=A0ACB9D6M1_9ASTR|nr:hypothetical protein L1987_59897 [Smallanthus sonchifolius]